MQTKRSRSYHRFLLAISIVCSLLSLTALLMHPEGTGSWRTSLNVIAVVLVTVTATMRGRSMRVPIAGSVREDRHGVR